MMIPTTTNSRALCAGTAAAAFALALAACGGGNTDSGATAAASTSQAGMSTATGNSASPASSGTISAFGSVFVNGHEFDTRFAHVIDDDTGASTSGTAGLEVGMAVDIKPASTSTPSSPMADEVHVHPLARGIVDTSDASAGTLTVLGQSVQLTAATNFSDHRACLTATTSPCTAISGQTGLTATSGTGSAAVGGTYVTVNGYLYSATATAGSANIIATLVSVSDVPSAPTGVNYKAEGLVTAVGTSTATIGGLTVDLASASCFAADKATACAGAFSVGQIVSAYASAAPTLPATTLTATVARLRPKLTVQTAGADIELEGKVASVATSPAAFVIRGVTVDASALTTALPAVGDDVRVVGTVATGGTSVTATSVTVLHAAIAASVGLEGNLDSVVAGTAADTFTVTLLGQSIAIDATTRLADRSSRSGGSSGSTVNPFNIKTFKTYLAASASQHVLVRAQADATGQLTALAVTIVPASTAAAVGGIVDASPAPVNSTATGTPTTFSVHGLSIAADPSSIAPQRGGHGTSSATTIAAGDLVLARGTYASGKLTVAATPGATSGLTAGPTAAWGTNFVIDVGAPSGPDHDAF